MPELMPPLRSMLERLIAAPSVSSVNAGWDQSNLGVVEHLATWLEQLGFGVEVLPLAGSPGKYNLVASAGSGPNGLILSGDRKSVV